MKNTLNLSLLLLGALTASAADPTELGTPKEKVSYSFGLNIGNNFKNQEIELDLDTFIKGFRDAQTGAKALLTDEQIREVQNAYRTEHTARMQAKRKEQGEKNKVEGEKFLADNKGKPGIVTLPSGLQYKVIKEGDGAMPSGSDTVSVHYRGTLLDGTEFDSSFKRNQPASFSLNGVIKGWTEGLSKMKVGSKHQLFIPSGLAYGERGSGRNIGPNSTLIFDVELLSVTPAAPANEPVTSDIIKVPSAEELKKGAKIEIIKPDQLPKPAQEKK